MSSVTCVTIQLPFLPPPASSTQHHRRIVNTHFASKVCFVFNDLLMLTCMAPHRMTKAHPLACDCKPGWLLFSLTHPLACTCELGWVYSFQHEPTHPLACNCKMGWDFWSFFLVNSRTSNIFKHSSCGKLAYSLMLMIQTRQLENDMLATINWGCHLESHSILLVHQSSFDLHFLGINCLTY